MNKKIISPSDASNIVRKSIAKRRTRDNRLKLFGRIAIGLAVCFLLTLFYSIFTKGYPGFFQYYVTLDIKFDRERIILKVTCQIILYLMVKPVKL